MAADFPTIKSGAVACYGGTARAVAFETAVLTCIDASDYRWQTRGELARFTLDFRRIRGYDLSKITAHFNSAKGDFDSTWGLTFDGNLYENCRYAEGKLTFTEESHDRWSGQIEVVQTA